MQIVDLGRILDRPVNPPAETTGSVAYEIGRFFQLDNEHCLFTASMDEQGGGDKCVGNDGFIIRSLEDIKPEKAFPINRPDAHYKLRSGKGEAFLAIFPCDGGFVPLGAMLSDGSPHPAAGTGFLISAGISFQASSSMDENSEIVFEIIQLAWDGRALEIISREYVHDLLGINIKGMPVSYFCPKDAGFLVPFTTYKGMIVFNFQYDGTCWKAVECGAPFAALSDLQVEKIYGDGTPGKESEPSIQKFEDKFVVFTRGTDQLGRMYISDDGLNYKLILERKNNSVPQVLNKAFDKQLYLTTNPNWDMLRNPLLAYPVNDNLTFAQPVTIYDQGGVRDDSGESIPFVDHGLGVDVVLEGRKRHILTYRVCDLRERTFHKGMEAIAARIHKDGAPTERASFGGLYMVEIIPD